MRFEKYNPIGAEERILVNQVLASGNLSQFLGAWDPDFFGGPFVQKLEKDSAAYFGVKHALTFNSWTSGLIAAVGAIGINPGDQVIVTPWTMSASAMAILHWNAIPVFADIDPQTYCLDPKDVLRKITPRTKAIMSVDIYGQSANTEELMKIAKEYNLKVISDTAQAPGAKRNGKFAGTLTDVGGFSLNYHKHIHTGEGGILVTNDDDIAEKCRLIRNHGESVVADAGIIDITNIIGYNFRMTEIEAAIGVAQLPKLESIVSKRAAQANYLSAELSSLKGLITPFLDSGNTHVYYVFPMQIDTSIILTPREEIVKRLEDSGLEGISTKYQNIHLLPIFQSKIAYGNMGFPWSINEEGNGISYAKGICPVAEHLQDFSHISFYLNGFNLDEDSLGFIVEAFVKVWKDLEFA
ncbi:WecE Predicted pyridoxal phosphate-dependent enzyme apparently involved in regulation of cell wall biogenesis [Candidatus Nanopelagicaceae bacterium]